jgi:hypothetical protein
MEGRGGGKAPGAADRPPPNLISLFLLLKLRHVGPRQEHSLSLPLRLREQEPRVRRVPHRRGAHFATQVLSRQRRRRRHRQGQCDQIGRNFVTGGKKLLELGGMYLLICHNAYIPINM